MNAHLVLWILIYCNSPELPKKPPAACARAYTHSQREELRGGWALGEQCCAV